jgi:hypothetical protein
MTSVLVAPDSFKGSLTSTQVAEALVRTRFLIASESLVRTRFLWAMPAMLPSAAFRGFRRLQSSRSRRSPGPAAARITGLAEPMIERADPTHNGQTPAPPPASRARPPKDPRPRKAAI